MPSDGKKGITVKIDAELHAEVRQYIESHEMTMAEFVSLALRDELHPQNNMKEEKSMKKMRTLALQIPEDLFQRIKDYLHRNNMTQKDFIIGLIEDELERDLTERESASESAETEEYEESDEEAAVSDFETVSEEAEEDTEEQTGADFSDEFEAVSEGSESDAEHESYDDDEESEGETEDESYSDDEEFEDETEDESEEEHTGFSMGM